VRYEWFRPELALRSGPPPRNESARRDTLLVFRSGGGADDVGYALRRAVSAFVGAARSMRDANVRRSSAHARRRGRLPLRKKYQGLGIRMVGQIGTQTLSIHLAAIALQSTHAAPLVPHTILFCAPSGTHVPPLQHPMQSGEQSIVCPQLLTAVTPQFWLPQVVLSGSGVHPQTPGVPPPPQLTPVPLQMVQLPPPVPHASSSSMWHVPLAQHPAGQLVALQTQVPPTHRCPSSQMTTDPL
jgi:hypothetical protein